VSSINDCLSQYLLCITKEADTLPEGTLCVRYRNDLPNFTKVLNRKVYGITKKPILIYQLARRQFLTLQIPLIKQILKEGWTSSSAAAIKEKCNEIDALLTRYERAGLDIDQVVMTPNQRIWNSVRHSQKPDYQEGLIYPTNGRVFMRSKSEQAIGNLLERFHIPYRYESRLRINNIDFHPDFIIMLPTDRLLILEHVGRMDLADYNKGFISRLQSYNSSNLLIGRDVFLSFEHDTRDAESLMKVIIQMLTANPVNHRVLIYAARNAGCNI
jgi:hypothetical protein